MTENIVEDIQKAIQNYLPSLTNEKINKYVDRFFDKIRMGTKIEGKVEGNYGTYTVSIDVYDNKIKSACSCYIGGDGFCHHCKALGLTFLQHPKTFKTVKLKKEKEVQTLADLQFYLKSITLDSLLKELKTKGITQKAFAESIGMSTQHLSSVKSCELKNRYYHELGATKLACLWVLKKC